MNLENKIDYEIVSLNPLFRMILDLKLGNEIKYIPVSIDYSKKKVYFEDNFSLNLDYSLLEFQILEKIGIEPIQPPDLDFDIKQITDELSKTDYGHENLENITKG